MIGWTPRSHEIWRTPDETSTLMRLYHELEQEGTPNWSDVSAKLANASQGGALNAKLSQADRIRSSDDVRQKVRAMLKQQQVAEKGSTEQITAPNQITPPYKQHLPSSGASAYTPY